jgi:hypothetical protein
LGKALRENARWPTITKAVPMPGFFEEIWKTVKTVPQFHRTLNPRLKPGENEKLVDTVEWKEN